MSDLDDKLVDILRWCKEHETWNDFLKKSGKMEPEVGDYTSVEATSLQSIKQALTDEGYIKLPYAVKDKDNNIYIGSGKAFTTDHKELMTGQEWYERFEKELPDTELKAYLPSADIAYKRSKVMEVAKRAAGIDHE